MPQTFLTVADAWALLNEMEGRVRGRDAASAPSLRNPMLTLSQELAVMRESLVSINAFPDDALGILEGAFRDFAQVYKLGLGEFQ